MRLFLSFLPMAQPGWSAAKRSQNTKRSEEPRREIWILTKPAFRSQPDISTSGCSAALRSPLGTPDGGDDKDADFNHNWYEMGTICF